MKLGSTNLRFLTLTKSLMRITKTPGRLLDRGSFINREEGGHTYIHTCLQGYPVFGALFCCGGIIASHIGVFCRST